MQTIQFTMGFIRTFGYIKSSWMVFVQTFVHIERNWKCKKLSEHIWLVAAQTPTSNRVRLGMAGPVVRTPAKRPRLTGKSPDQPQQDLSPQSTPPRSRSPRYLRRSPPASPPFNGFEPAQMKPDLNWSQLDEEFEETNELDKCFYEPASIIVVTPCKRKRK